MRCTVTLLVKHIQKDYKVKKYIPRAVASVMTLTEKLTDEEVDEMILETDVDDTHCSEQIVDVPVPQIDERIVEVANP